MPPATILAPTIHRNGSPPEHLIEAARNAKRAVNAAVEALCAMHPNGRDYYPQGDGALQVAEREHQARMTKLREVLEEVTAIGDAIRRRREGPVPVRAEDA